MYKKSIITQKQYQVRIEVMEPYTLVFIGKSGSGKGTQVELLKKKLAEHDDAQVRPVFHLESGARFREFIAAGNYSGTLASEINQRGELQPSFLSVWVWSHLMVENIKGGEHLILDGTPRREGELDILDSALQFYGRKDIRVIHVDISRDEAARRLTGRGRGDDQPDLITRRLDWFEENVVPTIERFRGMKGYTVHDIDGERSVEEIHADIVAVLGLK